MSFTKKVLSLFYSDLFIVSILFQVKPSFGCNDIHHIIIGTSSLLFAAIFPYIFTAVILILEHATILHASGIQIQSALAQAQSQYFQFAHAPLAKHSPMAFQQYSDAEFQQFIFHNRLLSKHIPLT